MSNEKQTGAAPRATGAREAAEDCVKAFVAADFTHLPLSDYKCKWAARIIEEAIAACQDVHIDFSESPCGHSSQYAYSEDGGKRIVCLLCQHKAACQSAPAGDERPFAEQLIDLSDKFCAPEPPQGAGEPCNVFYCPCQEGRPTECTEHYIGEPSAPDETRARTGKILCGNCHQNVYLVTFENDGVVLKCIHCRESKLIELPAAAPSEAVRAGWVKAAERMPKPHTDGKREWYWVSDGALYDVAILVHGKFLGHRELDVVYWMEIEPPVARAEKALKGVPDGD